MRTDGRAQDNRGSGGIGLFRDRPTHVLVNGPDAFIQNGHHYFVLRPEMVIDASCFDPCSISYLSKRDRPIAMVPEKSGGNVKHPFAANRASGRFDLFTSDRCICHRIQSISYITNTC